MFLKENTTLKGGDYRIIRPLGQGGFGITYLALQTGLNREVVVKEFFMREHCYREGGTTRVSTSMGDSRESVALFRDKFLKEARNIAVLRHISIVSIYDVFEENDTAYYVMEYHGAGSLGSLVDKRGALNEEDALFYIRQVAVALKYVHARKMMHLDVKPDNILIDEDGNAVLIDFGLSKRYNEKGKATSAASTYGTSPGYTPMEQYGEGGVGEFSPATDIYSLGATLFTLLTGEIPPPALRLVDSRSLQSGLVEKNVSGAVAEAVIKSMSFMREARPQSIDEFLALLDAQPASSNSASLSSSTLNSGTVSRSVEEKGSGASRQTVPMRNDSAEVSRSAARSVNSGTVSRSVEEKGSGASRQTVPMRNDSAEVSCSAARSVNSGTVPRSVDEKVNGSGTYSPKSEKTGRKKIMGVTGLALIGFLFLHMLFNLTSLYSARMYNYILCEIWGGNWYALIATVALAVLFVVHIVNGFIITLQNKKANGAEPCCGEEQPEKKGWVSKNMFLLGVVIILGLSLHLFNFRAVMQLVECGYYIDGDDLYSCSDGHYSLLKTFANPVYVILYLVWLVALCLHISHGFCSALRTVGWDKKIGVNRLQPVCYVLSAIIILGFAAVVLWFTMGGL